MSQIPLSRMKKPGVGLQSQTSKLPKSPAAAKSQGVIKIPIVAESRVKTPGRAKQVEPPRVTASQHRTPAPSLHRTPVNPSQHRTPSTTPAAAKPRRTTTYAAVPTATAVGVRQITPAKTPPKKPVLAVKGTAKPDSKAVIPPTDPRGAPPPPPGVMHATAGHLNGSSVQTGHLNGSSVQTSNRESPSRRAPRPPTAATNGYGHSPQATESQPASTSNDQQNASKIYVNEIGIGQYMKLMRQRFAEGEDAQRQTQVKLERALAAREAAHLHRHDSYDDTSSVSSEISEPFDELSTDELTGSSLSDNHMGHHERAFKQYVAAHQTTPARAKPALVQQQPQLDANNHFGYHSLDRKQHRQPPPQPTSPPPRLVNVDGESFYQVSGDTGYPAQILPSPRRSAPPEITALSDDGRGGDGRRVVSNYHHTCGGVSRPTSCRGCLKSESPYASLIQRTVRTAQSTAHGSVSPSPHGYEQPQYVRSECGSVASTVAGSNDCCEHVERPASEIQLRGSNLSLVSNRSTTSNLRSAEERYQAEIRKLSREIESYKEKVQMMSSRQSTYDSVVLAFEHSLQTMKQRLHSLMVNSERKDSEINELRKTMDTMYVVCQNAGVPVDRIVLNGSLHRRHTFTEDSSNLIKQNSVESVNSLVSQQSAQSAIPNGEDANIHHEKRGSKLRSSLSRAFGRNTRSKHKQHEVNSIPESPGDKPTTVKEDLQSPVTDPGNSSLMFAALSPRRQKSELSDAGSTQQQPDDLVGRLRKALEERDAQINDMRLEALTSAHQLDQIKDEISRYKSHVKSLEQDLSQLRSSQAPSEASAPHSVDPALLACNGQTEASYEDKSLRLLVGVRSQSASESENYVVISSLLLSRSMSWHLLDSIVDKLFKEYVMQIDPVTNLGLSGTSIIAYSLGQYSRFLDCTTPEHSPYDCLRTQSTDHALLVSLRSCPQNAFDALAFHTLVPKNNVQRIVSALMEQRRLILCGPYGTGKSNFAYRLAEYVVSMHASEPSEHTILSLAATHKNAAELAAVIAERMYDETRRPHVIIIRNLHLLDNVIDAFTPLSQFEPAKLPYFIVTAHVSFTPTSLQVHHHFRVVLWNNRMEPVRGFLGRYLRRKLLAYHVRNGDSNGKLLLNIAEYLVRVWEHINKFLEQMFRSAASETTIGPRVFFSCPLDVDQAREWFIGQWNNHVIPYLQKALLETQRQNTRGFEDPTLEIMRYWPWPTPPDALQNLGLEEKSCSPQSFLSNDPIDPLCMLMQLREQQACETLDDEDGDN